MLPVPIPARRVWQRWLDNLFPARRKISTSAAHNMVIVPVVGQPGTFDVLASTPLGYAEEGTNLPFSVTVTDKGGASDSQSATINATNAP